MIEFLSAVDVFPPRCEAAFHNARLLVCTELRRPPTFYFMRPFRANARPMGAPGNQPDGSNSRERRPATNLHVAHPYSGPAHPLAPVLVAGLATKNDGRRAVYQEIAQEALIWKAPATATVVCPLSSVNTSHRLLPVRAACWQDARIELLTAGI